MRSALSAALANGCIPDADDASSVAGDRTAPDDALKGAAVRAVRRARIMQTMERDTVHRHVGACCRIRSCAAMRAAWQSFVAHACRRVSDSCYCGHTHSLPINRSARCALR